MPMQVSDKTYLLVELDSAMQGALHQEGEEEREEKCSPRNKL